ncbi:hypothetical protein ABC426_00330 [Lactiplantibacillus plantarum]|uniref:hypothetical protein n=1 Tax=Lactiplantibacillus plantarum TaxID=1590 RepID=UPI003965A8CA
MVTARVTSLERLKMFFPEKITFPFEAYTALIGLLPVTEAVKVILLKLMVALFALFIYTNEFPLPLLVVNPSR